MEQNEYKKLHEVIIENSLEVEEALKVILKSNIQLWTYVSEVIFRFKSKIPWSNDSKTFKDQYLPISKTVLKSLYTKSDIEFEKDYLDVNRVLHNEKTEAPFIWDITPRTLDLKSIYISKNDISKISEITPAILYTEGANQFTYKGNTYHLKDDKEKKIFSLLHSKQGEYLTSSQIIDHFEDKDYKVSLVFRNTHLFQKEKIIISKKIGKQKLAYALSFSKD